MMSISSAQYTGTFFVSPLQHVLGASLAAVQAAFSLFVALQTFLSPLQGFLVDRVGSRPLLSVDASLMMASWALAVRADSLGLLYANYGVLEGLGSGIIYVGLVGLVVSRFPDQWGFAERAAAAGSGVGAILATFPVASIVNEKLSRRRADAVRDALVHEGISPQRMITKGYRSEYPVASNKTAAGRQENRRVEVVISGSNGAFAKGR
ncbi:MAG: OmpA family protein [Acidiferrobacter sp.]